MKKLTVLFFLLGCNVSFANLYLKTEYQERKQSKITTKHHIFLENRYVINYAKKSYVLVLKKITKDEATIESETYNRDPMGKKVMMGGSLGTYKVGKTFTLTDHSTKGLPLFTLKITLERIVP